MPGTDANPPTLDADVGRSRSKSPSIKPGNGDGDIDQAPEKPPEGSFQDYVVSASPYSSVSLILCVFRCPIWRQERQQGTMSPQWEKYFRYFIACLKYDSDPYTTKPLCQRAAALRLQPYGA